MTGIDMYVFPQGIKRVFVQCPFFMGDAPALRKAISQCSASIVRYGCTSCLYSTLDLSVKYDVNYK
jgi:hypothetical protein